ncbi:MAG: ABC transporter ATP-binding protein [Candidatus Omnitrophota bacterium]
MLKGFPRGEFFALKGVSLALKREECLGVIGRNGSGKTTLLKIICGVSKPTSGELEIIGRRMGILELCAGFEGDLTGRENIYLNGALLGLLSKEIGEKIESIIDFADIGDFIDAPVRTYSNGMYLRLGFAIAVNISADILIIDEVFAVGDEAFQEKCLKKLKEFKSQGKTIVFVSHDLKMIKEICDRVIVMEQGSIISDAGPQEAIKKYLSLIGKNTEEKLTKEIEILSVYFYDDTGRRANVFRTGQEAKIVIEYLAHKKIENPVFGIGIYRDDMYLIGPNTRDDNYRINFIENKGIVEYKMKSLPLTEGNYKLSASVHNFDETMFYDYCDPSYDFTVVPGAKKIKYGIVAIENTEWGSQNGDG